MQNSRPEACLFTIEWHRPCPSDTCMYQDDYDPKGFHWIDADNTKQSIYSFYREEKKELIVCVMNCLPIGYERYDLCVPQAGAYQEILNSESDAYDGCGMRTTSVMI